MNKQFRVRESGYTITYRGDRWDGRAQVRARSHRHADRIARDLGWYSYCSDIPGRPFAHIWYNGKYLINRYGYDV